MALQSAIKSLPFVTGPDTKTDPKLSDKPSRLTNAVFRNMAIQKRPGRDLLTSAATVPNQPGTLLPLLPGIITTPDYSHLTGGEALFTYGDQLTRINGGTLYGLSSAENAWIPASGGGHYANLTKSPLVRSSGTVLVADYVEAAGVGVVAWIGGRSSGGIDLHILVNDVATGTVFQTGATALIASAESVRCIALGSRVVVLAINGANMYSTYIDTNKPTVAPPAMTTIRSDVFAGTSTFDAFAYNQTMGVCVYPSSAANLTVFAFDGTGAQLTSPALATFAGVAADLSSPCGIHINRDTAGNIYLIFGNQAGTTSTRYIVISPSFSTVLPVTNILTGTAGNEWDGDASYCLNATSVEATTNQLTVIMTQGTTLNAGVPPFWLRKAVINASGIVSAGADIPGTQGIVIISDPVPFDGTYAFAGVYADVFNGVTGTSITGVQGTAFVVTIDGVPIARGLTEQSGIFQGTQIYAGTYVMSRVCRAIARPTSASATFVFPEQGRALLQADAALANFTPVGASLLTVTHVPANQLPIVKIGGTTYIGGALPRTYDGQQVVETGFPLYPTVLYASAAGAAGGLSTGQYQYKFIWSWSNAQGELTRGPTCPGAPVTAAATNTATVKIETLPLSTRDLLPSGIQVIGEIYRTTANGTLFYRLGSYLTAKTNQLSYSGVDATTRSINFSDGVTDTTLVSGELLYTTGGVLDWEAPPAYSAACAYKNRLIILPSEDPYSWAPSSEWAPGETVRFSSSTVSRVPSEAGPLVNCSSLDGKLILFTENGAYLTIGDGPDLLGNNQYPPVERITSVDEGPLPGTPIIEVPMGLLYQSKKGIQLLDRSLNVQFIGVDEQFYSTDLWTLRSGVVDAENQEIRLLLDTGSDLAGTLVPTNPPTLTTSGGISLVYNYLYGQWSNFPDYGGQASCFYQGAYTMVRSDGVVWQENSTSYRDNGAYYSMSIEMPWLKLAGLQGFQRIWYASILGTYFSDLTLTWEVAYDYASTTPETPTWTDTLTWVGPSASPAPNLGGPLRVRHHIGHKCEAIKFRFTDGTLSGSGQGMALTDLSLEYGALRGVFRLPASQTA